MPRRPVRSADAARSTRGYATIVSAPSDGVVLKRHAETNAVVAAGAWSSPFPDERASSSSPPAHADRDAMRVVLSDHAEIVFDAFPGRTFGGDDQRDRRRSDPRTGTFVVKLRLAPARHCKSGPVYATIRPAHRARVAPPFRSMRMLEGHARAFVFVVDPSAASRCAAVRLVSDASRTVSSPSPQASDRRAGGDRRRGLSSATATR